MIHLERVKQLGIDNTKTLGLLPPAAFDEYAQRKTILVAITSEGICAGYILYRLTFNRVAIVHLCIDEAYRGQGIARLLIESLIQKTRDTRGIVLKCRHDHDANTLWAKLGFAAQDEAPGRSKAGLPLVTWWRGNGGDDLFAEVHRRLAEVRLPVVIDANVLFDLQGRDARPVTSSHALEADWLQDSIELCVTDETFNEINRQDNPEQRKASRGFAKKYRCLSCDGATFDNINSALRPHFGEIYGERDEGDLRQIARAIAADAKFFVTRDGALVRRSENIEDAFRLKILDPADLIVHLDELRREEDYQPVRFAGTDLQVALIGTGEAEELSSKFQNQQAGESKAQLLAILRYFLASPGQYNSYVVTARNGPLVLYVVDQNGAEPDVLKVPLLRQAARPAEATTLARHIAKRIVVETLLARRRTTLVTDRLISDEMRLGLGHCAFFESTRGWVKISLPIITHTNEIATTVRGISGLDDKTEGLAELAKQIEECKESNDSAEAIRHETALWPLKIVNATVPAYIVPIQARWARELLDERLTDDQLFGRKPNLALNTEAVYYRSCHGPRLSVPAHILWYVSDAPNTAGVKSIRACSRLDEISIGTAKELFRKYWRLGIYQWDDVFETAGRDLTEKIMAMRFGDTELMQRPIPYQDFREDLVESGCNPTMVGPLLIPYGLFLKLYARAAR